MLRSIPNKLLGVIAMFSAILILLVMPFADLSRTRGLQFKPLSKISFYLFVFNFLILMQLGAKHVEYPFIEFGQLSTLLYFSHFLIIVPFVTLLENSLLELPTNLDNVKNKKQDNYESNYLDSYSNVTLKSSFNHVLTMILLAFTFLSANTKIDYCDTPRP
ncbi:MAG: hypothetical protein EOP34_00240 [Rickettsiales bacterium]|nr:MAG: hypothetical protein EOP34_00240 [Rickettsiales bacterium]